MGGLGSGNFLSDKKTPVEACLELDLRQLLLMRIVQAGVRCEGTICWPASAQRACPSTIGYVVDTTDTPWMRLIYGRQILDEPTPAEQIEQGAYRVQLVTTQQHYGGVRWWFHCPLIRTGTPCANRVRQLYFPLGGRYFGCRDCHGLTYASRQHQGTMSIVREWPAMTVECTERSGRGRRAEKRRGAGAKAERSA